MVTARRKPVVFLDADVIFAGAAAPTEHGSEQAVIEVERNLAEKLPAKLPEFHLLVSRCLRVVPDPEPEDLVRHTGQADPKDLPILVAALREGCPYLLTFNVRHYSPTVGSIIVQRPGEFVLTVRDLLSRLSAEEEADGTE